MLKTQDNSTEHVWKGQNGPPEYDDLDSPATSTLLFYQSNTQISHFRLVEALLGLFCLSICVPQHVIL